MSAGGPSVSHVIAGLAARFAEVDPDTARIDARLLVAHALGVEPSALFARSTAAVPAEALAAIETLAARRLAHEPVSRILGRREFWGLDFLITPDTLDPRPDTETLVAAALQSKERSKGSRILDLGTGSGCVLLAILKDWPEATGLGVDISAGAVAAARENARRLGLAERAKFQVGDWCAGLDERFDLIVSNPPYIADSEIAELSPTVSLYDPRAALEGGLDGLAAYRALIPLARRHLGEKGALFLEIGAGQEKAVAELLIRAGFRPPETYRDISARVRCLGTSAA